MSDLTISDSNWIDVVIAGRFVTVSLSVTTTVFTAPVLAEGFGSMVEYTSMQMNGQSAEPLKVLALTAATYGFVFGFSLAALGLAHYITQPKIRSWFDARFGTKRAIKGSKH